MTKISSRWHHVALFSWLSCLAIGCNSGPFADINNPFARDDLEMEKQYGPTPPEQLGSLRALRARASEISTAEQERLSLELAKRVQNEVDPVMRTEVVRALGEMKTPSAVAGLRAALNDSDPEVRVAACDGWRNQSGPEAIMILAERLGSDTNIDVRLAATKALGGFDQPAAVQALGLALDDPDPALQHRAVLSLKESSGKDYGNNLEAWRQFARGGQPPEERTFASRLRQYF